MSQRQPITEKPSAKVRYCQRRKERAVNHRTERELARMLNRGMKVEA